MFPPMPSWDGLHPLIVHFPIVLSIVAPFFALAAALLPRHARALSIAALVLLAAGAAAAFVAVETGEAAAEIAERSPGIAPVLEGHERLATLTRNTLAVVTVLYGGVVTALFLAGARRPALARAANGLAVVVLLGAALLVANTAHQGGRLVHEFGVRALVAPASGAANAALPPPEQGTARTERDAD